MRIPVRALQDRELRLLVASRGVSTLGTAMAEVALAFAVLQIGSVTDLGLVLLAREIPTVISSSGSWVPLLGLLTSASCSRR
jgi:hypothetical protein